MRTYPYYAEIEDKQYKINTDFRIGLSCMRVVDDKDISDIERAYALIGLLFGEEAEFKDIQKIMSIITQYLQCGKTYEEQEQTPADFDFEQDSSLIQASFMSDYKLDLENEKMHWWKFCELISGLTEKCILNKVRDIRNINILDYTDSKERTKIIKAKNNVQLKQKRAKKEQEEIDEFEEQLRK